MPRLMESLRDIVQAKKDQLGPQVNEFVAEAAGLDDFASMLGTQMNRTLVGAFQGVQSPWRQYVRVGQVPDFRPAIRVLGSEAEDLLDLGRGGAGPYQDSRLTEQKYQLQIGTKGRMFSVTRAALINDDLNYLTQQPTRFGRAAARTLTKDVVNNCLEANLPAYDGVALFHASHGNLLTGGTSTLTAANLQTARQTIARNKFEGQYTGIRARYLVIPPELENTARIILESEQIFQPGAAATPAYGIGNLNPMRGTLEIIIDPWLTSTTGWYVLADPADIPAIEVAFLNGRETPDLLVQRPEYRLVAGGGEDPYLHGEFDELRYAVRYDYGIQVAMWQGAFKGAGV
jgi:hypothetical protein